MMATNVASSYEYYEESEEDHLGHRGSLGRTSPRKVSPRGVKAAAATQKLRPGGASSETYILYLDSIRTLHDLLKADHLVLGSFKTTPMLLEHFNLT